VGLDAAAGESDARLSPARRFFMADDLHGDYEWEMFEKRIRFVFPDRPIVEIDDKDPIFHTVFDLDDRFQVPGQAHLRQGCRNCRDNGVGARWRGIL